MIAQTLVNLGEVVHHRGGLDQAEASYQEALAIFRELGDKGGMAFALAQLGKVELARNDVDKADTLLTESLALRVQVGDKLAIVETLEGLAAVACERGQTAAGVRLFGSTEALRRSLGTPLPASYAGERELTLAAARNFLDEPTFRHEWDRGQSFSLSQAISEASGVHRAPKKSVHVAAAHVLSLPARER
jgi:tetratricopeptide (TPR) repeat protein